MIAFRAKNQNTTFELFSFLCYLEFMIKERILIIEDNQKLAANITKVLASENFATLSVSFGGKGLQKAVYGRFDLIILDLNLPDLDGIQVCKQIREKSIKTPILMLTARIDLESKVEGLDLGADDYLTKPFLMDELIARVRAILRRSQLTKPRKMQIENWEIDLNLKQIINQETKKNAALAPLEFKIIEFLLENQGEVKTSEQIYKRVWGDNTGSLFSTSLKVHIASIRKNLGADFIQTKKGFGYYIANDK
jgi:DNA-binding response OmpR family regulator